jgi:small-conductance mechanosensitive channel
MDLSINNGELLALAWLWSKVLVILLVALVAGRLLREYLLRLGTRKRVNVNIAALLGNLLQVGLVLLALVLILPMFGVDWTALLTVLGAVGLAVSLAFQDLLRNFIAGIYILIERPFTIGDEITVHTAPPIEGTVQTLQMRIAILQSPDGVLVVVPNNTLFSTPITNHTAVNMQRDIIRLTLSDTDLNEARQHINAVLAGFPDVAASPAPSITVEESSPALLKLRVEFWTPPHLESTLAGQIVLGLRAAFPTADIAVLA